jgi:hypothetical protein
MTYTNLVKDCQSSISVDFFLDRIIMSEAEKERLMNSTRTRILNEIGSIQAKAEEVDQAPDFSEQIKLMLELKDYGFELEALKCLGIMQLQISESYPQFYTWFKQQAAMFGVITLPIKFDVFVESSNFRDDKIFTVWCVKGTENNHDVKWTESAIPMDSMTKFCEEKGLNISEDNTSDHQGNHVQKSEQVPLFIFIMENIDRLIAQYIQEGWELIEL